MTEHTRCVPHSPAQEVKQIADIMLRDVFKRGEEKGLRIEVTEKFKDRCAGLGVGGGAGRDGVGGVERRMWVCGWLHASKLCVRARRTRVKAKEARRACLALAWDPLHAHRACSQARARRPVSAPSLPRCAPGLAARAHTRCCSPARTRAQPSSLSSQHC